jgi:hypothetical protein
LIAIGRDESQQYSRNDIRQSLDALALSANRQHSANDERSGSAQENTTAHADAKVGRSSLSDAGAVHHHGAIAERSCRRPNNRGVRVIDRLDLPNLAAWVGELVTDVGATAEAALPDSTPGKHRSG